MPFADNAFDAVELTGNGLTPSFPHNPFLLANGNVMVYDNGNRRNHEVVQPADGVTKAVEIAFSGTPPTDASIGVRALLHSPACRDPNRFHWLSTPCRRAS